MDIIPIDKLIDGYSKCDCGAVTFYNKSGESISCDIYNLEKYFPAPFAEYIALDIPIGNVKRYDDSYACDHCVNHYGIDLCACGSGESYEKCNNGFDCCGTQMQSLNNFLKGVPKELLLNA